MSTLVVSAVSHLEPVAIPVRWLACPVMDIAVSHSVAVFHDDGEFLGQHVIAVVAVPPSTAPDELGGVAIVLVMYAEAVGILAVALPIGGVVVVVGITV